MGRQLTLWRINRGGADLMLHGSILLHLAHK